MIDHPTKKLGRMPSRRDRRTLRLGNYIPSALPVQPAEVHWEKVVPADGWGVMGNDSFGNCVICCAAHIILSIHAAAMGDTKRISDDEVIALSRTMGALDGYNILDRLNYWRKTGMWGHKIWAFASIDPHDHEAVKLAVNEFGAVDFGVNLPIAWRDSSTWETGNGRSYRPGSWGGHSVPAVGYSADGLAVVSWGEVIPMTWLAWDEYVDEAYASILPDWLAKEGVTPSGIDLPRLRADLTQATA